MRSRRPVAIALAALALAAAIAAPAPVLADVAPDPAGAAVAGPAATASPPATSVPLVADRPLPYEYRTPTLWEDPGRVLSVLVLFLVPLGLTLLVEVPVLTLFGRGERGRTALVAVLLNTLTNPVLVFVLTLAAGPFGTPFYNVAVAVLEVGVLLAEWALLRWAMGWSGRKAFTASLVANALSLGLGALLWSTLLG